VIFFKCGSDKRRWQTIIILYYYDEGPIISSGIVLGPCARSNIIIRRRRRRVRLPRPENMHNAFIRGGWRSTVGRSVEIKTFTRRAKTSWSVTIIIYDIYKYIIQYIIRSINWTLKNITSHHYWLQIIGGPGSWGVWHFYQLSKLYRQALRPSTNSVNAPKHVR